MVKPIDMLFGYPEFAGAPNVYETLADFHRLNSGVFVAEPNVATYEALIEKLDRPGVFWRRTDQTFLETAFPDWHKLPYTFNTMQYVYFNLPELWVWKCDPRGALPVRKAVGGGEPEAASASAADRSLVAHVRRRGAA